MMVFILVLCFWPATVDVPGEWGETVYCNAEDACLDPLSQGQKPCTVCVRGLTQIQTAVPSQNRLEAECNLLHKTAVPSIWQNIQKKEKKRKERRYILQTDGNSERLYFLAAPRSLQMVTAALKLKDTCSLEGKLRPTQTAYQKAETLLCQQRSIQTRLWFFQQSCMDVRVGL